MIVAPLSASPVASTAPNDNAASASTSPAWPSRRRTGEPGRDSPWVIGWACRERTRACPMRAIRGTRATPRTTTLRPIPRANAAGMADSPIRGASACAPSTVATKPLTEASVGRSVLRVA